jgi:chemotaxis protein histidine kinase CheA
VHVSDLKAKLFGGDLTGLFDLKNNDGTGLFSGQLALADAAIASALPNAGLTGTATVSATLSTSGKSVDAMMAALSGSGTAAVKGLTIANLNPSALPAIITQADKIGRDIDAARTAAFAPGMAAAGSFAAADADVAFTVAGGAVRVPPLTLQNPAATLSSDLTVDLAAGAVSATGSVAYRPGDEALVGSEPVINFALQGPLGATKRSFDSGPLAQFLTQRALEKEQQRVEAMQAALLEKQRLRREVRYYASLQDARDKAEERRQLEEMRVKAETEARERARALAAAQAKAEADAAAAQAAAEAKAKADAAAEAQRKAAEEERKAAEAISLAEQEKARREAEKAAQPAPQVERAPLPPPQPQSAPISPAPKKFPSLLDGLFDTQ